MPLLTRSIPSVTNIPVKARNHNRSPANALL
jgi:hypothetical protein